MATKIKTSIVIDGHSMLYKAYFRTKGALEKSFPQDLSAIKSETVSVFKHIISELLETREYDYKVIAFDISRDTFRRQIFPEYKNQRTAMPTELKEIRPQIIRLMSRLGIYVIDSPKSFEADDVIASLSKQFTNCEIRTEIFSTDQDLLQLVNHFTSVHLIKKNSLSENHNHNNFQKLNGGLLPYQIPLLKALSGDPSDNYKGIPGIGKKTSLELVNTYKNKENLFKNLDKLSPKTRTNLIENEENLNLYLKIAKAVDDLELSFEINNLSFPETPNTELPDKEISPNTQE